MSRFLSPIKMATLLARDGSWPLVPKLRPPRPQTPPPSLVPKLRLEPPFNTNSIPVRNDIHQPRLARIVPSTGITPVQRVIDIASFNRIVMNVLQLLLHHLGVDHLFWHACFLPHLCSA